MRYIILSFVVVLLLCGCANTATMKIFPGREDGTIMVITMEGRAIGKAAFMYEGDKVEAEMDNRGGDLNLFSNVKDITVKALELGTTRAVIEND